MFFKMMSGDVISIETTKDELLEKQLSNVLCIPSYRIHLIEDEKKEDTFHVVVNNQHPHICDLQHEGFIKDDDGLEYEYYVLKVYRYDNVVDPYCISSKEDEWWNWESWEISFYYDYRNRSFKKDLHHLQDYSLLEILSDKKDMPQDTENYMMKEAFKLWEERP
jgi:hypothetical protein